MALILKFDAPWNTPSLFAVKASGPQFDTSNNFRRSVHGSAKPVIVPSIVTVYVPASAYVCNASESSQDVTSSEEPSPQ